MFMESKKTELTKLRREQHVANGKSGTGRELEERASTAFDIIF